DPPRPVMPIPPEVAQAKRAPANRGAPRRIMEAGMVELVDGPYQAQSEELQGAGFADVDARPGRRVRGTAASHADRCEPREHLRRAWIDASGDRLRAAPNQYQRSEPEAPDHPLAQGEPQGHSSNCSG